MKPYREKCDAEFTDTHKLVMDNSEFTPMFTKDIVGQLLSFPEPCIKKWQYESGQYLATALVIIGVLFNNAQVIWCFPLWIISNAICFYYHKKSNLRGLMLRDLIFIVLAIAGWIQWSRM